MDHGTSVYLHFMVTLVLHCMWVETDIFMYMSFSLGEVSKCMQVPSNEFESKRFANVGVTHCPEYTVTATQLFVSLFLGAALLSCSRRKVGTVKLYAAILSTYIPV